VWAVPYDIPIVGYSKTHDFSVVTLRVWSTKESPRNFQLQKYNAGRLDQAAENTTLTDVLYPSDWHEAGKRIRLKQEFLLVSASIQDIIRRYLDQHDNFRDFADKVRIQINDTHPALVVAELIHLLTKIYDLPWKMAREITETVVSYTNHTVLSEALEQWDESLMEYLLPRQIKIIQRLNQEICDEVRHKFPNQEDKVRRISIIHEGKVKMANLAIIGSHAVNGVAAIHTEILKKSVFKDFYEMTPQKFFNITNGVTQRRWLLMCNPELAACITKRIGEGWITHFEEIRNLSKFAQDPELKAEIFEIKQRNKQRLMDYIRHHVKVRDARGLIIGSSPVIDGTSLFDVQVKRFHEYKRQLMNILHCIMLFFEIKENKQSERIKRTVILSGKAAASYETAKNIIQLIYCVARKVNRDPDVSKFLKVIFVENYNVSKAEIIIPAADLSEQISIAGYEASGTGNMKLSMNGALTIGTNDGANVEMRESVTDRYWPFSFGMSAEEVSEIKKAGSYSPVDVIISHPLIKRAVESLRDSTFAQNEQEHQALSQIYRTLMDEGDRFLVLKDLPSYYETQKKVEFSYKNQEEWLEYVIHNIAGMGPFSTDNSITNYANLIWGIKPLPMDLEIIEQVRNEYRELDKCRIF
jgi:starch phosphorylase